MEVVIGGTLYYVDSDSPVQDLINEIQADYNDIELKLEYDGRILDNELTWKENEVPPLGVVLEIQHSRGFTMQCNKILFDEIYKDTEFDLDEYIERGEYENFHLVYAKYEKDLHVCRYVTNIPLLKLLIEAGADVNAGDKTGHIALMLAENTEVIKLLIEAGADVNAQDKYGRTALTYAENLEKIKLLIEAGADVNTANKKNRWTALMYAKNAEKIKLLIEAGADVNIEDEWGNTALMLATNEEKITLLRRAGAT